MNFQPTKYRKFGNNVLELLKGHTPEQRKIWDNSTKTLEQAAVLLLECDQHITEQRKLLFEIGCSINNIRHYLQGNENGREGIILSILDGLNKAIPFPEPEELYNPDELKEIQDALDGMDYSEPIKLTPGILKPIPSNMITKRFKITGLSAPRSATFFYQNDHFWAVFDPEFDYKGLFNYVKNTAHDWSKSTLTATLQYEKQTDNGTPINATIIEVSEP